MITTSCCNTQRPLNEVDEIVNGEDSGWPTSDYFCRDDCRVTADEPETTREDEVTAMLAEMLTEVTVTLTRCDLHNLAIALARVRVNPREDDDPNTWGNLLDKVCNAISDNR